MRPLASPVTEFRLTAGVLLIGGAAFTAAAIAAQGTAAAVATVVVGASIYGGGMYVSAYRTLVRSGVEDPVSAPTDDRESRWATTRRSLALAGFVLGVCLLLVVAFGAPDIVAGIVVGNGAATWWMGRWLRGWEEQTGQRLLREPRWRWGRRDCYVVPLA